MYSKLKEWLNSKPTTKAAWIGTVTGILSIVITLILNTYIIYQNSQAIKSSRDSVQTAKEALHISIPPSLTLNFIVKQQPNIVQLQNSSPYSLIDMEIYTIKYRFENLQIIERMKPFPLFSDIKHIEPQKTINIDTTKFFQKVPFISKQEASFFSFVIVCKRETDSKRFVIIEPFLASQIGNNYYLLGSLYEDQNKMFNDNPEIYIKIIEQIERVEKVFFKIETDK